MQSLLGRWRIGICAGSCFVLALVSGCTQTPSHPVAQQHPKPTSQTSSPLTATNQAAITRYLAEVNADLPNASPKFQTIHAAATAISQDISAAITQSGTESASQLQQDEGLSNPSSPQFQQLTQCDNAAGSNQTAIQACIQSYSQNFANPIQSNAALFAQIESEVQTQLATTSSAFTSLAATWTTESNQLEDLRPPPAAEAAAVSLAAAYSAIESDCNVGEQAASTPITSLDLAYAAPLAVTQAESQLFNDSEAWATDFQNFENAVRGAG
jgi:hypothetical protein